MPKSWPKSTRITYPTGLIWLIEADQSHFSSSDAHLKSGLGLVQIFDEGQLPLPVSMWTEIASAFPYEADADINQLSH